jgi:hypothetical protein
VRVLDGLTLGQLDSIFAVSAQYAGGVFISGR